MSISSLRIDLAERSYSLQIGSDLSGLIRNQVLHFRREGRLQAVLTDAHLAVCQDAFLQRCFSDLPFLVLPSGEETKSFHHLQITCNFLAAERMNRQSILWVVGGGVMGDLGGFAAASFLRGIAYVQVPTTLLAMVDSSVGGKTGINLSAGKNLVGAFWQPLAVFADTGLLATLPPREFAAGMAEVLKYGLIKDLPLWERLEQIAGNLHSEHVELPEIILRCCAIKAAIVSADEYERDPSGGRALLNLGHTFGHAIEAVAGFGEYLHGEAVAIGLVLAARLSELLGKISAADVERVQRLIAACRLPVQLRKPLEIDRLFQAMRRDKKVQHQRLRFVILEELGEAQIQGDIDEQLIQELWRSVGAQ